MIVHIDITRGDLELIAEILTAAIASDLPQGWGAETPSEAVLGWHACRSTYVSRGLAHEKLRALNEGVEFDKAQEVGFYEWEAKRNDHRAALLEQLMPFLPASPRDQPRSRSQADAP